MTDFLFNRLILTFSIFSPLYFLTKESLRCNYTCQVAIPDTHQGVNIYLVTTTRCHSNQQQLPQLCHRQQFSDRKFWKSVLSALHSAQRGQLARMRRLYFNLSFHQFKRITVDYITINCIVDKTVSNIKVAGSIFIRILFLLLLFGF